MSWTLLPLLAIASTSVSQADTIVWMADVPEAPRWAEVEETLSVGLIDGDPDYNFFGVTGLAIGIDGSMVVLEAAPQLGGRPLLRMYDAEGRFIRHLGRPGQGPGEFVRPTAVASMPDGRFLLADLVQGRMLVYSAEGVFEESWRVPHQEVSAVADGAMWVSPSGVVAMRVRAQGGGDQVVRLSTHGGHVVDTLPPPDLPELATTLIVSDPPRTTTIRTPYQPVSRWAWHPHGFFVTARTDRYAIDLLLPRSNPEGGTRPPKWREGDPVVSIRAEVDPVPIHALERRDQQRYLDERVQRTRGETMGSLLPVPSVKPVMRWIHPTEDGRFWVHVFTESERVFPDSWTNSRGERVDPPQWRSTFAWDVFEPDGTYLGRVRFPDELSRMRFRGDEVWGFVSDELGVPILKRYRIRWPTPG